MTVQATFVTAADIFKGQQIYNQNCLVCHGNDGRPVVPDAPDFTFGDGIITTDLTLLDILRNGKGSMPAYRGIISDEDLLNVIGYLRTLQR